ncbi:hypothetical protein E2C01_080950 [Portunus trituberculatus]|uniref:Uncharacterized protein n=1 Tax=Portunus trituberculatus TaxID=210409 RepID=A0A5B7J0Y8_PORTR|nr:hypothetical protein [Portunus trituberculatus]
MDSRASSVAKNHGNGVTLSVPWLLPGLCPALPHNYRDINASCAFSLGVRRPRKDVAWRLAEEGKMRQVVDELHLPFPGSFRHQHRYHELVS